jgi:hypothetical protein
MKNDEDNSESIERLMEENKNWRILFEEVKLVLNISGSNMQGMTIKGAVKKILSDLHSANNNIFNLEKENKKLLDFKLRNK